jgi:alpha-1,6-mannosyltransferase
LPETTSIAGRREVRGLEAAAPEQLATIGFALLGVASLVAYAAMWLEPLWLGRFEPFEREALAIGPILGLNTLGAVHYALAAALPMALYVTALLLLPVVPRRMAWRIAIAVAVAAPLLLLYTYPALAADAFDYLMTGRVLSEYGQNPYTYPPAAFESDPYYPPAAWKGLVSVYGPLWVLIAAAVTETAGSDTLAALLAVKALSVIAHWATAGVVFLVARRLAPERALFAFVAYAWNPLALLHFAVDGHNDSMLLLFVMVAVYLALDRKWMAALPALTLAVLVKFVPAVLLPLFLWQARHDRRQMASGLAASAAVTVALAAPLWAGIDTFDGVRAQASFSSSSLGALAAFYLDRDHLRVMAVALFGAGYAVVLWRRPDVVRGSYWVLLLYLLVLSFWTKPWYFTWVIALGAAIGGAAFWVTVAGSVGLLASNMFGSWAWLMNWFNWQQRWGPRFIEGLLTASTLGGWLAGLAAAAALWRRKGAGAAIGAGSAPDGRAGRPQGPANTTA